VTARAGRGLTYAAAMSPLRSCGLALLGVALAACPSIEPEPEPAADPLPDETRWYVGESAMSFPGVPGTLLEEVLIRRTVSPAGGTLVESVISVDDAGTPVRFEIEGTIEVGETETAWSFGFTDNSGDLEGVGTLQGDAWAWDSWSSRTEYVTGAYVGSYVESDDERTDEGIVANKRVYSPDDHYEALIVETLDRVDEATWTGRADELGFE